MYLYGGQSSKPRSGLDHDYYICISTHPPFTLMFHPQYKQYSLLYLYPQGLMSAQTVTLTSSVEQDGRQAACPREVVTFTCMVNEATRLRWIAEPFIPQSDPITFVSAATAGAMAVDDSGQFRAVLVSIVLIGGGLSDFNSRLTVTASGSGSLNGTEIQCSGRQSFSPSRTLIIAGTYNTLYRRNYARNNFN